MAPVPGGRGDGTRPRRGQEHSDIRRGRLCIVNERPRTTITARAAAGAGEAQPQAVRGWGLPGAGGAASSPGRAWGAGGAGEGACRRDRGEGAGVGAVFVSFCVAARAPTFPSALKGFLIAAVFVPQCCQLTGIPDVVAQQGSG